MRGKEYLSIEDWLKSCKDYFSFGKFRKFFNILAEERLEKELIKHFNEWNNLYV